MCALKGVWEWRVQKPRYSKVHASISSIYTSRYWAKRKKLGGGGGIHMNKLLVWFHNVAIS